MKTNNLGRYPNGGQPTKQSLPRRRDAWNGAPIQSRRQRKGGAK